MLTHELELWILISSLPISYLSIWIVQEHLKLDRKEVVFPTPWFSPLLPHLVSVNSKTVSLVLQPEASLASSSLCLSSHLVPSSLCQLYPKSVCFSPSLLVSPLLRSPQFLLLIFCEPTRGMFCKSSQQTCHSSAKNPAIASHFSQSKLLISLRGS